MGTQKTAIKMNMPLTNAFKQLNTRDRAAIYGLAVFLGMFALFQLGVSPLLDARAGLARQVAAKQRMIQEMAALIRQYQELQAEQTALAVDKNRRNPDFRLFTFLDRLAGQTGIKPRIVYMKPSSFTNTGGQKIARVEMKCNQMTMKQLTTFLYQVESSPNQVRAGRLSLIKDRGDDALLDAVMQFETHE